VNAPHPDDARLAKVAVEAFRALRREAGVWIVEIPGRAETTNDFRRMRGHQQRSRITREWRLAAGMALTAALVPPVRLDRADVTVTRVATGTRRPDPDGVAGGAAKAVLDALVDVGIIVNDDEQHLRVRYETARCLRRQDECLRLRIARWEGD